MHRFYILFIYFCCLLSVKFVFLVSSILNLKLDVSLKPDSRVNIPHSSVLCISKLKNICFKMCICTKLFIACCLIWYKCFFVFSSEIFPYLVVIIGLENVLILTKSVVSTPVHLEVKYRVAQGLFQSFCCYTSPNLPNLSLKLVLIE